MPPATLIYRTLGVGLFPHSRWAATENWLWRMRWLRTRVAPRSTPRYPATAVSCMFWTRRREEFGSLQLTVPAWRLSEAFLSRRAFKESPHNNNLPQTALSDSQPLFGVVNLRACGDSTALSPAPAASDVVLSYTKAQCAKSCRSNAPGAKACLRRPPRKYHQHDVRLLFIVATSDGQH